MACCPDNCNCSNCCSSTPDCGCLHQHNANCSYYHGANLTCIGVNKGYDLEEALIAINDAVCALTPSGNITVVNSCSSDIGVTSSVSGLTTTYTVCLNTDITNNIAENTSDISVLQACLASTVEDIVSNTLDVTVESSDGCGRTLRIETITPSGTPVYDGIVHNDTAVHSASGGGGNQQLATWTEDLNTKFLLSNKDNVIIVVEGQYAYDEIVSHLSDTVVINIRDSNGGTVLWTMQNIASRSVNKSGYRVEITLTKTGATTGQLTAFWFNNLVSNGTESVGGNSLPKTVFSKSITGLNYSTFTVEVRDINDSLLGATYNFLNHLQVEVRKNIN